MPKTVPVDVLIGYEIRDADFSEVWYPNRFAPSAVTRGASMVLPDDVREWAEFRVRTGESAQAEPGFSVYQVAGGMWPYAYLDDLLPDGVLLWCGFPAGGEPEASAGPGPAAVPKDLDIRVGLVMAPGAHLQLDEQTYSSLSHDRFWVTQVFLPGALVEPGHLEALRIFITVSMGASTPSRPAFWTSLVGAREVL